MPKESLETLISELAHEEDWRRMRATAACLKGGPKAVDGIIHAVPNGSPKYKVEAIRMLARIRDSRAGISLVQMINDENEEVSNEQDHAKAILTGEHLCSTFGIFDVDAFPKNARKKVDSCCTRFALCSLYNDYVQSAVLETGSEFLKRLHRFADYVRECIIMFDSVELNLLSIDKFLNL